MPVSRVGSSQGMVDVSLRPELVAAAAAHAKKQRSTPSKAKGTPKAKPASRVGQTFKATVEMVKEEYVVVSSADGLLAFAAAKTYNDTASPFLKFIAGREGTAVVLSGEAAVCSLTVDSGARVTVAFTQDVDGDGSASGKTASVAVGATVKAVVRAIKDFQMNVRVGQVGIACVCLYERNNV